jgi:beta-lactamase class A
MDRRPLDQTSRIFFYVVVPILCLVAIPLYILNLTQNDGKADTPAPTPTDVATTAPLIIPTATNPPVLIATANATPIPTLVPSPTPTTAPQPSTNDQAAAMEKLLNGEDGVDGVVLIDQNGNTVYTKNQNTPFISASLYKLVLMADIFDKVEKGDVSLDDKLAIYQDYFSSPDASDDSYYDPSDVGTTTTVNEALFAMGAYSSNVAAEALLTLTSWTQVQDLAHQLGMTDTYYYVDPTTIPDWPEPPGADSSEAQVTEAVSFIDDQASDGPVMLTTPHDIALFFTNLLHDSVIDATVTHNITDILAQQTVNDRFPVLLPSGTRIVHKTGDLDGIRHDAGIIYTPYGPVILVAMVEDASSDDHSVLLIQRLALIAYGDLDVPPYPS